MRASSFAARFRPLFTAAGFRLGFVASLALIASLLLGLSLAQAEVTEGARIVSIGVQGNERVETEAVLDIIRIREGSFFRANDLSLAIRDIYRLRYFLRIRVEAEAVEGGVALTFVVQEKPVVREVVIEGNKKVTIEDIKEVMTIRAFSILDDSKVQAAHRAIEDLYREKGFFLADITLVHEEVANNEVNLTFSIRENKKVLVKQIQLVGNKNLKSLFIKNRLQTKAAGIFPGAGEQGTYRRDTLDTDSELISYLYSAYGYVDAQVSRPQVYLTPDKRWVYVTIHIDEGEQYRVGTVDIAGDFLDELGLSKEELAKTITAKPGEVYNRVEIAEDVQRLVDAYSDEGYAFANVIPIPKQDRERKVIDLNFQIQRGQLIYLEDIVITGNLATWDKTIRREVSLVEGELFRGKAVERTRRRLEQLGYFEDIKITTPRGEGENSLDLAIDVTEKPTGSFSIGAGFSSVESFVFTASISRANFLGLGYTMSLNANLSLGKNLQERGFFNGENSNQQIQFQIFDPYFLDTRWTASFSIFSFNRTYVLSEQAQGLSVSLGHWIGKNDDARFSLRYNVERVGMRNLRPAQQQIYGGQLYRGGTKSSLVASIILDRRNNRIAPTKGFYLTGSVEFAGGFRVNEEKILNLLGGDMRYMRAQANWRLFYPLGTPHLVFRWNLSFGWIHSLDGTLVPYSERYKAGGINSIRGFSPFSLGPAIRYLVNSDPNHAARNAHIGGTLSLVNNVEIEFPIIPPAQVRGVVFFDAGNAFGGLYGDEPMRFEDIRLSAGFGIRWRSPMGPLRFEWGFPIGRKPGERGQVFEFTIGSFF